MKSIDIKSLLIGILGTALVMVLMGQSSGTKEKPQNTVTEMIKRMEMRGKVLRELK